jgi:hypothetical protein
MANAKPTIPTDDKVTIQLFRDGSKCSQPITVTINGIATVVPRGVPVQVSKDVADILEMKALQDNSTLDLITGLQNSFTEATDGLGK